METRLHAWTPRRSSAGLKARLFGREREVEPGGRAAFGWLAPATVGFLLLFVTLNQREVELPGLAAANQAPMMAVTWSNVSFAAYLPGSFVYDQNTLPRRTFEWTNQGHSPSSIPSFPQSRTNDLKRQR